MSSTYKQASNDKAVLRILYDQDCDSPRKNCDNLGTMLCNHKRYTLGDETFNSSDYRNWGEALVGEVGKEDDMVSLPLWLYDHSGLSLKTCRHGQHSNWDCGQVGYIYVKKEKIRREYGVKRVTKRIVDKVIRVLESEIEIYSDYLNGECYGFKLEDNEGNEIESCWGFIGSDINVNGIADYIPDEYRDLLAKVS